jgi:hypothetical protein
MVTTGKYAIPVSTKVDYEGTIRQSNAASWTPVRSIYYPYLPFLGKDRPLKNKHCVNHFLVDI